MKARFPIHPIIVVLFCTRSSASTQCPALLEEAFLLTAFLLCSAVVTLKTHLIAQSTSVSALIFNQANCSQNSKSADESRQRKKTSQPCRKQHTGNMDSSAHQFDTPMELNPTFEVDLDETHNGENNTPHQSFQQVELYPAFNQGDFACTSVPPGERYDNILPLDFSAYPFDTPMELNPTFDVDLDEALSVKYTAPPQSFHQAELYSVFNQGDFASFNLSPGEQYRNFQPVDCSGYQSDVPVALHPASDADLVLDEIFNGENATPHQSFHQAELYPAFNQGDFDSTDLIPGERYHNFLPQDPPVSSDPFQPGLQGNAFSQRDFPMTENLFQSQIDGTFQQDHISVVDTPTQAVFYDNISQQGFHSTGIVQSAGHPDIPKSLACSQALNQVNLKSSVQQGDLTASPGTTEQTCFDAVAVVNKAHDPKKSVRGYSHHEWEAKKDVLYRLWVTRDMPMLIETMTKVYGFTACSKAYSSRFNKWGFPHKNRTKANVGRAILRDDDKNLVRKRPAQRLRKSEKGDVPWAFMKNSVSKGLKDKAYNHHSDMINHLENLAKCLFDKGDENGWTYNEFTLVPPSGAKDNSKTWQLLTHQCYSASTLAECGLSSRVTPSLQRLFDGLGQAAEICNPNVLIYFWNICTSLNRIRMSGMPKRERYPLLYPLLATLVKSFSNSRQNKKTSFIIGFLNSLIFILETDPEAMRETLEMGYKKVIEIIGKAIGHDHAIVLNMASHYCKHYNAHIVDQVRPKSILEKYKHLIEVAESTCGSSEEQTIALRYDYIRATSLSKIDYDVVLKLQKQTAGICKAQPGLQYCLATRAFAFSTELLANMHFEKEIAGKKALREQQAREQKQSISENRALVEKEALAEQKSPPEAEEIANKKALAEERALTEKKRLAREGAKKEIAEAREREREQKQAKIKAISETRALAKIRALAEKKPPAEVKKIGKEVVAAQKRALAEKKKQEALATKSKLRIQGPELPPRKSLTYLNEAISVLQEGDQDCLIWAASFSKRLSLWHQISGDREACRDEKDRTVAIRLKIEATQHAKNISCRSKERCKVRGGTGNVNGLRIKRREAHQSVVSSLKRMSLKSS
ncbi:hypothetical protein BP6252_13135 [Coleophoma cylindrospora]|uniref:Clr5 domain-containing protein n=1 Tax=Coleophoma cylindrospora TaxID=1849047 RepID=A0A3D8QA35_9HELO|nr:hypothetical protein BP6252_13135 [Coleophoma cylindrospora]